MRDLLEFHLSSGEVERYGILRTGAISKLRKKFLDQEGDVPEKIWLVLVFQMWCNQLLKK